MPLSHRQMLPADLPFVKDAWMRSFRRERAAGVIPMSEYFTVYGLVLDTIIARPGCQVIIAASDACEEPEYNALGFLCFERGVSLRRGAVDVRSSDAVVHYVYTKQAMRKMGVASFLFSAAGIDAARPFFYTFDTADARRLRAKIPDARCNPLIARYPKDTQQPEARSHEASPSHVP